MKVLAFGLGVGIAVGAVRQAPPVGAASWAPLCLVIGLLAVACYLAGRKGSGARASAVAVASAEATAEAAAVATGGNVNVQLVMPSGEGPVRWSALDSAPWIVPGQLEQDTPALLEHLGDEVDAWEPSEGVGLVREGVESDEVG